MILRLPGDHYILVRRDRFHRHGWFACMATGNDYYQGRAPGPLRALWVMFWSRRLNRYDSSSVVEID